MNIYICKPVIGQCTWFCINYFWLKTLNRYTAKWIMFLVSHRQSCNWEILARIKKHNQSRLIDYPGTTYTSAADCLPQQQCWGGGGCSWPPGAGGWRAGRCFQGCEPAHGRTGSGNGGSAAEGSALGIHSLYSHLSIKEIIKVLILPEVVFSKLRGFRWNSTISWTNGRSPAISALKSVSQKS